jgi:Big-like domain-containing protein/beta-propeller repeat-containing protein
VGLARALLPTLGQSHSRPRPALARQSVARAEVVAVAVGVLILTTLRFGANPVDAQQGAAAVAARPAVTAPAELLEASGALPLAFIPNVGQTDDRVSFLAEAPGANFWFTPTEATVALVTDSEGYALQLGFVGADPAPTMQGAQPSETTANYFLGSDESEWRTDVPTYGEVVYGGLWPETDLTFRGAAGKLEYQFNLRPGAKVDDIRLVYRGAQELSLDEAGNLLIQTPMGELMDSAPVAYQEIGGSRVPVESSYVIAEGAIGFQVGAFDPGYELIIDPGLVYSTFLGGTSTDQGFGIAVDGSGNAYVTGFTTSANFPTTFGSYDPSFNGGQDVFVTKFNATGSARLYSTYIGGTSNEQGLAIAVDSGFAYVTGFTGSSDFPTASALPPFVYRPSYRGGSTDAFVLKLGPAGGSLIFSTYAGGSGADQGLGINVHSSTDVYVTGDTRSTNFGPTTNARQPTLSGPSDAFFLRLDRFAAAAGYMTYLGGSGDESGRAIAIDEGRNVYLTGDTTSGNYPTSVGAFDTTANGSQDAFVTKLRLDGSASGTGDVYGLAYSTYLGGGGVDRGFGIARDAAGDAYVTGVTSSSGATPFPTTAGAIATTYRGGANDAFATKVHPVASAPLLYSTYLGGGGDDRGAGIAIESNGSASLTGRTSSSDFPTTPGAFDTSWNLGDDAFVTKLATSGSLLYSTFLGGSSGSNGNNDRGQAIALDPSAAAYVTGLANSSDFPTTPGAYDTTQNGDSDAFVTKLITIGTPTTLVLTPAADTNEVGTPHTVTATVTDFGGQPVSGVIVRFSVSGVNPTSGASTTNASGQATFTYTGTHAGTDTISAYADTNGNGTQNAGEPSGIATKLWTAGPPATLTLAPKTATNTAGDQHCVTATVKDQFGNPTPGITVTFTVTGANTAGGPVVTDTNGQATFCYTGIHAGTDTITATAVGGSNPSDTARKTYEPGPPASLTLAPKTATNTAGHQHCVTATVVDQFANPTPGITVNFSVAGPNGPLSGSGTTDANGQATFCYTGTHAGTDTITAKAVGGSDPSDTATKTYEPDVPASLALTPKTATNTAGDPHCVTATVKDQFGNPTPGILVSFSVAGPNGPRAGAGVTDANGQTIFCYTGTHAGTDTITARAFGGSNPSDTATKTYGPGPPASLTLTPETATNVVDARHCVTAHVEDVFGNPTPGITVDFSVTPPTFRTPSSGSVVTDGSGNAVFCYTSALPGQDVITATARGGTNPTDTAHKTWVLPPNNAACKVTYGGWIIATNGDRANFGGNAQGNGPKGQEEYQDHGPAMDINVHSINVLAVTCSRDGTMASIFGKATVNGAGSYDYRIDVRDLGEPGRNDRYRIRLSNGYDSGDQQLRGGNVQAH